MAGNFNPNHAGIAAILNGEGVRRVLRKVCEKGKSFAESIAPVDMAKRDDGVHYKDAFEVRDETILWRGEHPGPRAAARLQNTRPYAAAVEYGYRGRSAAESSSAHRVLGRTLDYLESEGKT